MTSQPDVGIRIELGYIGVQLPRSLVISILVLERLHNARVVARIGGSGAITNRPHGKRCLLSAAAPKEQVVIDLVVGCRPIPVEHSWRCPLQSDHDCRVILIGPNMATQAIAFPAEIRAPVERLPNILPVCLTRFVNVCVGCHQR